MRAWLPSLLISLSLAASSAAFGQSLRLETSSNELYAQVPFVLSLSAEGFDEEPQPDQPELVIKGCKVTPIGVSPSVSTMIQIINGVRSESRRVIFNYRYRVEATKPGVYSVPALTLVQGTKSASTNAAQFRVRQIAGTRDMRLRLNLPTRPVWVGEPIEVTLDWFLAADPEDQTFAVPLFDGVEGLHTQAPPTDGKKTLPFSSGSHTLNLPYDQGTVTLEGRQYTRFRFHALVTPERSGRIELPPATVAARLSVGVSRDAFGFRVAKRQLFKATDMPKVLEIKALPLEGRPASFSNAVGESYSMEVRASRTVARAGDPIDLTITIRGRGNLQGLALPRLDVDGGLEPRLFDLSDELPVGELIEDGKGKRFTVTARLKSESARSIPALAFSYFDPKLAQYRTVRSEPIALSVSGSSVVSADDVVSAAPDPTEPSKAPADTDRRGARAVVSLVGAELALSRPESTLARPILLASVTPVVGGAYFLGLLLLLLQSWRARTRDRRGESVQLKKALQETEEALLVASSAPAREAAPRVVALVRSLAQKMERELGAEDSALLDRIETEAFDPRAAEGPLSKESRDAIRSLIDRWKKSTPSSPDGSAGKGLVALLFLVGSVTLGFTARAQGDVEGTLEKARAKYAEALEQTNRAERAQAFLDAETLFGTVAESYPDRPELLTDWGNAALGAQELGRATLRFRRALSLDSTLERARRNLSWVRGRMPSWVPKVEQSSAMTSLFFWKPHLNRAEQHLLAAAAFLFAMILLAPWSASGEANRKLRRFAPIPGLVWAVVVGSTLVDAERDDGAVVVSDGALLRSADSFGAPAVLREPLPPGVEVTFVEARESWARVELFDGTSGWVRRNALERVL